MNEPVIRALRAAIETDPAGAATLRIHLAAELIAAGAYAEAFDVCAAVLREDPGNLDALDLGAKSSQLLGSPERADRYESVRHALSLADDEEPEDDEAGAEVVPLRLVTARVVEGGDTGVSAEVESRDVRLADVMGMEEVKRRLQLSFLGPMQNPELRRLYGKSLRGGLLLWGPPGCGKTFIARAVAGELGARFINVGLDDVLDMYIGQSERNLHGLFALARRSAPCVLFFDEVDALGQKRSRLGPGSGRNVVAQLLSELDGLTDSNEGVYVLAATNHPWDVDTALRRPGRFDRMLLVLPPDRAARRGILGARLRSRPHEGVDIDAIARDTEGFSGADLVHLVESATELALSDSIESGDVRPVGQADFVHARSEIRGSTEAWLSMARTYAEFASDGGAYDELLRYMRARKA